MTAIYLKSLTYISSAKNTNWRNQMPTQNSVNKKTQELLADYNTIKSGLNKAHSIRAVLAELCIEQSITEPEFYKLSSILIPQSRSFVCIEYFTKKHNGKSVKSSENRGNLKIGEKYYSFKSSCNDNNKINIVQIRLWQECDFIVQHIEIGKKVTTFLLTREEMKKEVMLMGTSAHGTEAANLTNQHKEMRISFEVSGDDWNRWIEKYQDERFPEVIIS